MWSSVVRYFTSAQNIPAPAFHLTDALRIVDGRVSEAGFRTCKYTPEDTRSIPIIEAVASSEKLYDIFDALLAPLPDEFEVVLETSHALRRNGKHHGAPCDEHIDFRRESIDRCVLQSLLADRDFEELILHDGATGIAVVSELDDSPVEVQLDQHKTLRIYADEPEQFREILRGFSLKENARMQLPGELLHHHNTSPEYARRFSALVEEIGAILDSETDADRGSSDASAY